MLRRATTLVTGLFFVGMAVPALAQPMSIAVFNLEARGKVPKKVPRALTGVLIEAAKRSGARVITLREATQALGFSPEQAVSDCSGDELCLAQIGVAVEAQKLVVGTVKALRGRNRYKLEVLTIDVTKSTIERRTELELSGAAKAMAEVFKSRAYDVLAVVATGEFSIEGAPAGATVIIDGEPVGSTPLQGHSRKAGSYSLVLSKSGHETWEGQLVIEPGQDNKVRVSMPQVVAKVDTGDVPEPSLAELPAVEPAAPKPVAPREPPPPPEPIINEIVEGDPLLDVTAVQVGWVSSAVVGVAAVAVGGIMGYRGLQLEKALRENRATTNIEGLRQMNEDIQPKYTMANILFGVGGAALLTATGLLMWDLLVPDSEEGSLALGTACDGDGCIGTAAVRW